MQQKLNKLYTVVVLGLLLSFFPTYGKDNLDHLGQTLKRVRIQLWTGGLVRMKKVVVDVVDTDHDQETKKTEEYPVAIEELIIPLMKEHRYFEEVKI